jgi:DNA-binding SARP family transcriptional activator/streptogramin lyase
MEFRILGPVGVLDEGRRLVVRRGKEEALLGYLLLHPNAVVPTDRLIDELWGEAPPPTARKNLQNAVSALRKVLGEDRIVTEAPGYRLRVGAGELDVDEFQRLAGEGRKSLDAAKLREALALWRGEALASLRDEGFAQRAGAVLEEARVAALEDRIDADLAEGRDAELVPELEQLLTLHPLRERVYGQLMLALYRGGRQADALDVYRRARTTLNDELGLEPGPQLQDLERRLLNHDPALAPSRDAAAGIRPRAAASRRRLAALVVVLLLPGSAATIGVLLATRGDAQPPVVVSNSLVKVDPRTNKVVKVVRVGRQPLSVALGKRYLWVVNAVDQTVTRLDTQNDDTQTTGGLTGPVNVAADGDRAVWVTTGNHEQVIRIEASTLAVDRIIRLRHTAFLDAVGDGSLWVSEPAADFKARGLLAQVDLRTTAVKRTYRAGVLPAGIGTLHGSAWVGNVADASVTRVNTSDGSVERISVGATPTNLATGLGAVWVIVGERAVWRLDPATRRVVDVIDVGKGPFSIAAGADGVWVGFPETGVLKRLDPSTGRVVATIKLHIHVHGIAVAADAVWVAIGDRAPQLPF